MVVQAQFNVLSIIENINYYPTVFWSLAALSFFDLLFVSKTRVSLHVMGE